MRKQRQLRRLDFDLIQTEMSVISEDLLRSIVGGYDNDCFWRCIAYIESGGSYYSESDAAYYAKSHFGSSVNLKERKDGAGMTTEEMKKYINDKYDNSCSSSYSGCTYKDGSIQQLLIQFDGTKLLQKSEMRKVIVIELSYKGFS